MATSSSSAINPRSCIEQNASALFADVVVLELLVQRRAIDLEDRRGLRFVAAGRGERGKDALLLELAQGLRDGSDRWCIDRGRGRRHGWRCVGHRCSERWG